MRASLRLRRRLPRILFIVMVYFAFDSKLISIQPHGGAPGPSSSLPAVEYEVTTTNYGWTTPSGSSFSRRILSGEFFNATLAHPRYNASAWADLEANPDPTRHIIAFMDIDTCVESNYPIYGGGDWKVNMEKGHPSQSKMIMTILGESCEYLDKASRSPALTAHPDSRLIVLDCAGIIRFNLRSVCKNRGIFDNGHVMVGYYSVNKASVRPLFDVGIPPPAIKPVNLTASERDSIQSCFKRKYLFSFQGKGGFGRENLLAFQNDTDFYVRIFSERNTYQSDIRTDGGDSNNFKGVMADSVFAGSPRGDLLFSYRFSEILSAGAVPVVYADGWLPPYNDHVVDWSKCAVFIPESDYGKTAEILRAIPEGKRCEMQKCALEAWDKFAATRAGWVRALVAVALSTSAFGVDPLKSNPS
ncbi:hypothetical protein ACHAXR_007950 [Thalassiosira sp. AJA248-18]